MEGWGSDNVNKFFFVFKQIFLREKYLKKKNSSKSLKNIENFKMGKIIGWGQLMWIIIINYFFFFFNFNIIIKFVNMDRGRHTLILMMWIKYGIFIEIMSN